MAPPIGPRGLTAAEVVGWRFGRLVVVGPTAERCDRHVLWLCRCDCGNAAKVLWTNLRSGHTSSCGCWADDWKRRLRDLAGLRFGRLVAVQPTAERRHRSVVWECRCDCGNVIFAEAQVLVAGGKQSCGCLRRG